MSIGLEQFAVTEISPAEMLAELLDNNEQLVARMREMHDLCDKYGDVATASLLEVWIDEAERQARFLFETGRSAPALTQLLTTRAREALMMAGAGGAMPATGRRATAIRFQQFGEGGSVDHILCPHARARGGRAGRLSRIGRGCTEQSDRLEPPGRRGGCWLTSPFLFSGIVVGRFWFGATMEVGGSGRSMMMSAGAGTARATGSSTTDRQIPQH
jgi:hypothetical protein